MLAASFVAVDIVSKIKVRLLKTAGDCEHLAQGGALGQSFRGHIKAYWSVRKYFMTASSAIRLPMAVPTSPELR